MDNNFNIQIAIYKTKMIKNRKLRFKYILNNFTGKKTRLNKTINIARYLHFYIAFI